jgi:hypothetical protein
MSIETSDALMAIFGFRRKDISSMDWQPMETVPRDGTPVDLWHVEGFRIAEAFWCDGEWSCCFNDYHFSHWILIDPPKGE